MDLGRKLFELRKKKGLSQEELASQVGVTRQTISNWELGETEPKPSELKTLSKIFQVSIDELLNNDVQDIMLKSVSNTEKLAGIIIKILKAIGILFIVYLVFLVVACISYFVFSRQSEVTQVNASISCMLNEKNYTVTVGTPDYFSCLDCDEALSEEIKLLVNFDDLNGSLEKIENYFTKSGGQCF